MKILGKHFELIPICIWLLAVFIGGPIVAMFVCCPLLFFSEGLYLLALGYVPLVVANGWLYHYFSKEKYSDYHDWDRRKRVWWLVSVPLGLTLPYVAATALHGLLAPIRGHLSGVFKCGVCGSTSLRCKHPEEDNFEEEEDISTEA